MSDDQKPYLIHTDGKPMRLIDPITGEPPLPKRRPKKAAAYLHIQLKEIERLNHKGKHAVTVTWLALRWKASITRKSTVYLSERDRTRFKLARKVYYNCLAELETEGYVTLAKRKGRAIEVTLL